MRVLEFEAKALLAGQGISIPVGIVVDTPEEAEKAAAKLGGPVVLKAQIPANKRMESKSVFRGHEYGLRYHRGKTLLLVQ